MIRVNRKAPLMVKTMPEALETPSHVCVELITSGSKRFLTAQAERERKRAGEGETERDR